MTAKKKKPVRPAIRFAETAAPMSGDGFRAALARLDINQSEFARLIGVRDRAVRAWISELNIVPMPVAYLVNLMIKTKTKPEDLRVK